MTSRSRWGGLVGALVLSAFTPACDRSVTSRWAYGDLPPVLADVNGDGTLDVLGYPQNDEYAAFDGNTFRQLWKTKVGWGPTATTKDRFVVATRPRTLRTFDLATGAQVSTITLSDEATSVCADGDVVWVHQLDLVDLRLDPRTGAVERGQQPPPICAPLQTKTRPCQSARAYCDLDRRVPMPGPAFVSDQALRDGDDSVAVRFKRPGTPEVSVVGYDAADHEKWRTPVDPTGKPVDGLDLAGGVVFIKQSSDVTAVDARNGAVLWRAPVGNSASSVLRATPSKLFVGCDGPRAGKALRVVDTHTGKIVATFGHAR